RQPPDLGETARHRPDYQLRPQQADKVPSQGDGIQIGKGEFYIQSFHALNIAGMADLRRRGQRRRLNGLGRPVQVGNRLAGTVGRNIVVLNVLIGEFEIDELFRAEERILAVIDPHDTAVLDPVDDIGGSARAWRQAKPVEPPQPLGGILYGIRLIVYHIVNSLAKLVVQPDPDRIPRTLAGIGGNGAVADRPVGLDPY